MDFAFTPMELVVLIAQGVLKLSQMSMFVWFLQGGWLYALRFICYVLDCKLINFISYAYKYFIMLISQDMFNKDLIDDISKNIYVFIGVIVFFRLMMLIVKYLLNPDLVGDAKVGANSLIQRCIVGMCGILFIPTIFDLGYRLQTAILKDQIIQQIIIPHNVLDTVEEGIDNGGKTIGSYVLAGFLSPSTSASSETRKEFKMAMEQQDLTSLSINRGGWLGFGNDYEYDYFVILSTFILAYVFYQVLKYAIDVAVRSFKLLIFRILAPVAMIEYMINGADDGVFKNWKTAVLSTYCMIFIRVMAIWFVIFVTMIMSGKISGYSNGSLLSNDDYLLRAIIIIALLGFMMDLPKIIGQIFGLDLEQEGSATGILKQVGGMIKGAAIGALAVGGSAVGGAVGIGKSALGMTKLGQNYNKAKKGLAQSHPNLANLSDHMSAARGSIIGAALGSNNFTGAAYKGYKDSKGEQKAVDDKRKSEEAQAEEEKYKQSVLANQRENNDYQRRNEMEEIVKRYFDTAPRDVSQDVAINGILNQLYGNKDAMTATICGKLDGISSSGGKVDLGTATASITEEISKHFNVSNEEVEQKIVQEASIEYSNATGLSLPEAEQRIKKVIDDNEDLSAKVDMKAVTGKVVGSIHDSKVSSGIQEVTQIVNQVQGTRVTNAVEDAGIRVATEVQNVQRYTENIQHDVRAQTNIQRNQVSMVDDIRENTERSSKALDKIKRDTHDIDSKM